MAIHTEAEMSDDKGKGKARALVDEKKFASQENGNPSILTRVAASTSGLTRSAFSTPSNNELSNHAAVILANAGKGQSSSSGGAAGSASDGSLKSQSIQPQAGGPAGVRVGHSEEHIKQSEDEFSSFLDGIDTFPSSRPSGSIGVDAYKDIGSSWGEAWARAQTTQIEEDVTLLPASNTIAEQERQDGKEVLDLLSGPGAMDQAFEVPTDVEDEENYDWGLTPDQISQIRAMTRHLPPPEPHTSMAVDDTLNLVPNLDVEGRALWIEQWEGVLARYTDEVWGGLLPLIKEARQEVEEIKAIGFVSGKPTALQRLEAILGHFQRR